MDVLGALTKEDAAAFEAHVAGCDLCAAEVRSLRETSASLPFGVTIVEPPPQLRERVLAIAGQLDAPSGMPFATASSSSTASSSDASTWLTRCRDPKHAQRCGCRGSAPRRWRY